MKSLNQTVYRHEIAQKSRFRASCYALCVNICNDLPIAGTPRFGPAGYCQNRTPSPSWRPVLTPDRSPFLRKGGGTSPDQEAFWNKTNRGVTECKTLNSPWRLLLPWQRLRAAWAMTLNGLRWGPLSGASERQLSAAVWPLERSLARLVARLRTISNARSANINTTHTTEKAAGASLRAAFFVLCAQRPWGLWAIRKGLADV